MNIQVRVLSRSAQAEIKALRAQVAALESQLAAANKTAATGAATGIGGAKAVSNLSKYGNQLQWTGRQLQYNWTLPILLAAGAATKFELDNEKAFTHVRKVYGDTQAASRQFMKQNHDLTASMANQKATRVFNEELVALKKNFVGLSNYYGVAQKDILEVAGAWAQAGKSGKALAESVDLTMQATLIGDMDATKATQALISIQAQYGLSTQGLATTLAYLNAVENTTAITMQGLIDGFEKSAGVAREAGIDTRHLAAMLAALTPAAGSAAQAGQALKTIITRLLAPTKEAAQVMNEMGLKVKSSTWQSSTAMERLRMTSEKFSKGLTNSQKLVAATVLGSRWQVNKFLILMRQINSETGRYAQALDATSSKQKAFATMNKELNAILTSNPKRLQQIWYTLQNGMADAIQPMIPYLLYLANLIRSLVTWFGNLNPGLQKMFMVMLLGLAAVGPLVRYFGSLLTLMHFMYQPVKWLIGGFGLLFTSETLAADGSKEVRAGLLRSAGAALAWPFKMVIDGFGAVAGALMFMIRALGINLIAAEAWRVAWFNIRMAWFVLWAGFMGAVELFQARFIAWAGASTMIEAVGVMFTRMFAVMALIASGSGFATVMKAFEEGMFRLAFIVYTFTAQTIPRMWAAMMTVLTRITVIMQAELAAAWSLMTSGIVAIYSAMELALARITAFGGGGLIAISKGIQTALIAVYVYGQRAITEAVIAGRALLLGAWAATQTAMAFLSTAFWTGMIRIWIFGVTSLIRGAALLRLVIPLMMRIGPLIMKALMNPWVLAILAIIGLIYAFRKQIAQVWHNIVNYFADSSNALVKSIISAWNLLPQGVQNAMSAVIRVVANAAQQVAEWMSYLNPFAKHSPSLVENVQKGMGKVAEHHKTVTKSGDAFKQAHGHAEKYSAATAKAGRTDPSYTGPFEDGSSKATAKVTALTGAIKNQQKVVDAWQNRLDAANRRLDAAQKKLDALKKVADKYSQALDDAKQRLSDWASTPLKGMQAMDDQIFANTMAQNKLQYAMMKMQDAVGPLDDVKSKLDAINGAQELLRGEKTDLRNAGAGSDVLSGYDSQITALEQTKTAYSQNVDALQGMQNQLDALQHTADELDLEKSLKFDQMQHDIEKASNTMKEMPFDVIMKGIRGAKADITTYTGKLNVANAAVDRQQKVVDGLTAARDRLSNALDREQKKLDKLNKAHSALAKHTKKQPKGPKPYVSPGLENFRDAAKGNFPVQPDVSEFRKNWNSQAGDIDKMTAELAKKTSKMFGDISPFGPIKKKWNEFKAWFGKEWHTLGGGFSDFFKHAFSGVSFGGNIGKSFDQIRGSLSAFWGWIKKWAGRLWRLFGPDLKKLWKQLGAGFKSIWKQVGPELAKFGKLIKPMGKALKNLWELVKPVVQLIIGVLLLMAKISISVLADTIKPLLKAVGGVLAGLIKVVRGAIEILIGILTLDPKMIWKGLVDVFGGIGKAIVAILKGAAQIILSAVKGIVRGIWNFFKWLWDELVGHSIVPDMIHGIVKAFQLLTVVPRWIWNHLVMPVVHHVKDLWKKVHAALRLWVAGWKAVWSGLRKIASWLWNHTLGPIITRIKSLWKNHVKPALKAWWNGWKTEWRILGKIDTWLWNHTLGPVLTVIKNLWKKHVKPELTAWWDRVKKAWNAFTNLNSWVRKYVMQKVADVFTHFLGKNGVFRNAFRNAVDAIGSIWNGLRDLAAKPVRFLVNTVYDKGIRKAVNLIPGVKNLPSVKAGFKSGGVFPGYTPGRDPHHFYSPTGGQIDVSGGEAFMRPEWTRAVGPGLVKMWNNLARTRGANAVKRAMGLGLEGDPGSAHFKSGGIAGRIPGAQRFARSQVGKPYIWGGVGPGGYDCSGFMSAITNYLRGQSIHHRVGATASFPWAGFKRGPGEFTIGSTNNYGGSGIGHMAGTLGGLNVESRGGRGVVVGGAARSWRDHGFTKHYHLGASGSGASSGGGGWVTKIMKHINPLKFLHLSDWKSKLGKMGAWGDMIKNTASSVVGKGKDWIVGKIQKAYHGVTGLLKKGAGFFTSTFKKFVGGGGGGLSNSVGGSAQAYARKALKSYGWSGGQWAPLKALWNKESGWRVHADNPSSSAYGIPQALPGSKMASAGPDWRNNAATQIKWGLRYIKGRYGSPSAAWHHSQVHNWYKAGGIYDGTGSLPALRDGAIIRRRAGGLVARIGEGSHDEAVTPLPHGWRSGTLSSTENTKKEFNFYGDLSFPNITDPNDAATFIENLENLAKD